jgi:hypothetical protein
MDTTLAHFTGNITLPNTDITKTEGKLLQSYINKYEPIILTEILGYTLYTLYEANKMQGSGVYHDLRVGADFTDKLERANRWQGFITAGMNPIANYIYCKYLEETEVAVTGVGTRKANSENMVLASPLPKMQRAWNEMVEWLWIMDDFLRQNESSYPDYIGIQYAPFVQSSYIAGCEPHGASNNKYFQLKNLIF